MRITGITDSQRNTGLHDPEDLKQVHALQDAIDVEQSGGPGKFEMPNWDQASQKKVRDALLVLGSTLPDFKGAFGTKSEVDPPCGT